MTHEKKKIDEWDLIQKKLSSAKHINTRIAEETNYQRTMEKRLQIFPNPGNPKYQDSKVQCLKTKGILNPKGLLTLPLFRQLFKILIQSPIVSQKGYLITLVLSLLICKM